MWQLRQAFARKEKIEGYLENLENLRNEGSIDEKIYPRLKEEYQGYLQASQTEIEKIKGRLVSDLTKTEGELERLREDLKTLEARHKIGQLTETEYQRQHQRILGAIGRTENRISDLKNWIGAKSSAEVGGYLDVKVGPTPGISLPFLPERRLAGFPALEDTITPLRVAGFVASLLMLIFVFLSWVSVDWSGLATTGIKAFEKLNTDPETLKARDFNPGGIVAILASIGGMAVALGGNRPLSRAYGYFAIGALSLLGIILFSILFAISYRDVIDISEEMLGEEIASGLSFSPGIGGILYLIATLAIFLIGYLELQQERR